MKTHHASIEEAKASAAEFLFLWELDVALKLGRSAVRFTYEDAKVIDRIPPPPGTVEIEVPTAVVRIRFGDKATVHVTNSSYPEPPVAMRFSPDLETLWMRYEGYRARREPLSAMAYFCLTVLETSAGGRAKAGIQYSIDPKVLGKLGELTAERGDGATARKMKSSLVPYTPTEVRWVEDAVKIIIRRVGETATGATRPMITMADLPNL